MKNDTIRYVKLEKHDTKDINDGHVNGSLTVIWRDWDKILEVEPKMAYVSSVNPGETKGPHLHTKRDSYFICIRGKVVFIAKNMDGKYHEIESSEHEPVLVQI
ncbi:MAG: WxcM-like domain-containing protein, partial [Nitrosopumilaceae archaeon]|nr:WxcM-like domain-containing protein [Nitrosopumilaceae archaeon]